MTIYQVFFKLRKDAKVFARSGNQDGLARVFKFVDWCFLQKGRNPGIWNAAATAFLEHLADDDESAELIPIWVGPAIFEAMRAEFEVRRERDGEGKFRALLENYNQSRSTRFQ